MYDLNRLPRFVASGKPLNGLGDIGTSLTEGVSSFGGILVETVDQTNHTPEGLIEFLQLKTITTRKAFDRSKSWWGRTYNTMTGDHPVYVPISGHHLIQTFVLLEEKEAAKGVPKKAECGIRLDIAEEFIDRLLSKRAENVV